MIFPLLIITFVGWVQVMPAAAVYSEENQTNYNNSIILTSSRNARKAFHSYLVFPSNCNINVTLVTIDEL